MERVSQEEKGLRRFVSGQHCDVRREDPGHEQADHGAAGVFEQAAPSASTDGVEGRPGPPPRLGKHCLKPREQDFRRVSAEMRATFLRSKGLSPRQEEGKPEIPP